MVARAWALMRQCSIFLPILHHQAELLATGGAQHGHDSTASTTTRFVVKVVQ
jgi:hypothetical protein